MPLVTRKVRPIPRSEGKLRDARLFVIASEDRYAPKQYFSFLNHPRIHVEVLETQHGDSPDASSVVDRLAEFEKAYQLSGDDQFWAFLDTDHWIKGNHKYAIIQAIQDARSRGFHVAMSNPCFDFWLLLHHEDVQTGVDYGNCKKVGLRIRELLGEFNKTNIKKEHYPISSMQRAILRAKSLDSNPQGVAQDYWPDTLCSRVYMLMDELINAGLLIPPV